MPDYSIGKVYKIYSDKEPEMVYIGSTCEPRLCDRMSSHRRKYKSNKAGKCNRCMCFDIFDKHGIENCKIELIALTPSHSKDELRMLEEIQRKLHAGSVNKQRAFQTLEERKQQIKEMDVKRSAIKVVCECGGRYIAHNKTQHMKTQLHINYISKSSVKE